MGRTKIGFNITRQNRKSLALYVTTSKLKTLRLHICQARRWHTFIHCLYFWERRPIPHYPSFCLPYSPFQHCAILLRHLVVPLVHLLMSLVCLWLLLCSSNLRPFFTKSSSCLRLLRLMSSLGFPFTS